MCFEFAQHFVRVTLFKCYFPSFLLFKKFFAVVYPGGITTTGRFLAKWVQGPNWLVSLQSRSAKYLLPALLVLKKGFVFVWFSSFS